MLTLVLNGRAQTASPGGSGGHLISGPAEAEIGEELEYQHSAQGEATYYWHIEGAATLNGEPAQAWPGGDVPANEPSIRIAWDSVDTGLVQLRLGSGDAYEVVDELLVALRLGLCDGRIYYQGRDGQTYNPVNITGNQFVCPNGPGNPALYVYKFNRDCVGDNQGTQTRPAFRWSIKYFTATGAEYEEQWDNPALATNNPYIKIAWLDRWPTTAHQTNTGLTPYNVNPPGPYPNAGTPFVRATLRCTGYNCGSTTKYWPALCGLVTREISVYYTTPAPANIAINETRLLCRDRTYTLTAATSPDATSYIWSASNGATLSATGTTATLNLSSLTPGANNVTITVRAYNSNAPCGQLSDPVSARFDLTPAPAAPQNMTLSGDGCPSTTDPKTLRVELVQGARYRWTVTGPGTSFAVNGGQVYISPVNDNTAQVFTRQAGQVTFTAQVILSDCNGPSAALSQSTYIGNAPTPPPCPTLLSADWECPTPTTPYRFRVTVSDPGLGKSYVFWTSNPQPSGTTISVASSSRSSVLYEFPNGDPTTFTLNALVQACNNPALCTLLINVSTKPSCRGIAPAERTSRDAPSAASMKPAGADLKLYPNPTTGLVSIQPPGETNYRQIRVYNALGQLLLERHLEGDAPIQTLDLSNKPSGIYTVRLFDGKRWISQRLVKE